jgi:hypothetical protein
MPEIETCSMCGYPMEMLGAPTERQALPVFVCKTFKEGAKPGERMNHIPCDGFAYHVANNLPQRN